MSAVQDNLKDASRDCDGEAEPPKSSGTMTLHNDDDHAASPLDDEPGRAASQRSLLVILMAFASAFYLYLGPRKGSSFDFHDGNNAFRTFGYTVYNLILLGFVGEFDPDNFDEVAVLDNQQS